MYLLYTSYSPSIPPFLVNIPFQKKKKKNSFLPITQSFRESISSFPPLILGEELNTMRFPLSPFNKRGRTSNNDDIHVIYVNNLTLLLKQMISYANF